jgi:3-oxoacyl-[acyl-carrier-protein] synthase II
MRRVVVTGLGVVAPNGTGKEAFWKNSCEGKSGIDRITSFDASSYPVQIAGEVRDFDVLNYLPNHLRKTARTMGRASQFGLAASALALQDGNFQSDYTNPERFGVSMGTGVVPYDLSGVAGILAQSATPDGELDTVRLGKSGASALPPQWMLKHLPNMVAAHISLLANAQGPNNTIVTACAAATQAVGEAYRLIARDDADVMLAGGADSRIDPLLLLAYTSLGALSQSHRNPSEVSRPFDRGRDGFVLGEGAGILLLEEYEHAKKRDANIYAEITGYGSSFDAFGITKPDPTGAGAARAMYWALREAMVDPHDVDYIAAHGTSTRLNDAMETNAVKLVFQGHKDPPPLSSVKSMIGHLIGAAGAVALAAMAMTLQQGVLPPTINQDERDPECDLDYVPNTARDKRVKTALANSFGFGGQNAALVMQAA